MDREYHTVNAKIRVDRALLKNEDICVNLVIFKPDQCLERISDHNNFIKSTSDLQLISRKHMPSIGRELSELQHIFDENRCSCCPYGYHIDLDFVPFSAKMLSRESEVERLQVLNEKWRSERESMDKLLGVAKSKMISQMDRAESFQSPKSSRISQRRSINKIESINGAPNHQATNLNSTNYGDILDNELSKAVADFEEVLSRTRREARNLSYSFPDSHKFHKIPRIKLSSKEVRENTALGLISGALTQTNFFSTKGFIPSASASTVIMKEVSPPSSFKNTKVGYENSLHSDKSQNRIEYLEGQVRIIPALEEEKRQLLKLLDNEKQKCAKLEEKVSFKKEEGGVSVTSLIAPPRQKTRDVEVGRTVATHEAPRTRSVGVGGNVEIFNQLLDRSPSGDSRSLTGCFSGMIRKRIRSLDLGIQVQKHDLNVGDPPRFFQSLEKVDCGVQVGGSDDDIDKSSPKPRVLTENASILAKAITKTSDIGCTVKPSCKDIGVFRRVDRMDIGITAKISEPVVASSEKDLTFLKKPSKTLGVNTEQLKQMTTGTNTDAVVESSQKSEYLSNANCSPLKQVPDGGGEGLPVEKPIVKEEAHKLEITTVISSVSAPVLSISTTTHVSMTASKSQFGLPKISSPRSLISKIPTSQLEPLEDNDNERPSTSGSFTSFQEPREKVTPSKEMQGALNILNDALLRGRTTVQVTSGITLILHGWFKVAGTRTANPLDVEDYLNLFESYSPQLLRYIVNMPDGNGNTAMHYAVSHANFDVVSILLNSKVSDPNKANKAGYTSVMLASLAKILIETHRQVVQRLFSLGDVNIKAAQHGQTALMLGASHGSLDTVKLLVEAGADINIQDDDGSTCLMCAAEHGHGDIVKYLLSHAECDPNITDTDGSTALSVAMEAGHKDIGVMLYAHMHFLKGPGGQIITTSTLAKCSRSMTYCNSPNSECPASLVAKRQQSSTN